ncbi:single-stranded DNA-binding protein [Gynurincola endophyticus]|uniref:single-stranded DNA-binding protein n=1 Tax=Gynurincola endophyticus TaxID=2479004 RepID=UPI000F8C515F|nr:single-stranded DNA-binding protein [Gynurincola endophyticus]
MIKLQVIGNLGKDCVTNNVNGRSVINFSVAHTERFKNAQGQVQDRTIWVECAYWTDRTAIAPYLRRGTQVYVEGQPEVRTYPKNDGSTGASLTLRVTSVQLLGSRGDNAGGGAGEAPAQNYGGGGGYQSAPMPQQQSAPPPMNDSFDDLPF